jgi:hypothetical protein
MRQEPASAGGKNAYINRFGQQKNKAGLSVELKRSC